MLLSIWLSQSVQTSPYDRSSANGNGASLGFPAKRVDDAINAYIVALNAAAGAPDAELPTDRKTQQTLRTLKETQEKIRRRF